jgi:outer membrane receptor for ferrienterochelin and colicin
MTLAAVRVFSSAALALVLGVAIPVFAQNAVPPTGVTVYDEAFFKAYGVVTARDMLERIPGMAGLFPVGFQPTEAKRGLRSETDQVLINGKRNTAKNNNVADYLERIPATQVLRIEVISGNVKEIDSAVSGRVVNVILRTDKASGSGAFVAGMIFISDGQVHPTGQLSYSIETGPWSATMGLETRARLQPAVVVDKITSATGVQTGRLDEVRGRDRQEYTGRARVSYAFPGGEDLQFSLYKLHYPIEDLDTSRLFSLTPGGERPVFAVEDRTKGHDGKFELTSDYVKPFGSASKFLGLAVFGRSSVVRDSEIYNLFDFGGIQVGGDARDEVRTEVIARGTIQTDVTANQQLEYGVEVARTTFDKDLDFFNVANGRRIDVRVFNSDTKIDEDRIEVFSSYSWKPRAGLEIEPGVAAEFSKLDQNGQDVVESRTFKFVKPSLNVWYNTTPRNRVFFSFLRDVGQLTFEDFAASFIREDDELVAGNPNLVPEKAWVFELGDEYRLANDAGVLQMKGFYRRVQDVNGRVPLPRNEDKDPVPLITPSGPGNVGDGISYGLKTEVSLKLAKLGLFDAVIGGTYLLQDSRVTDAFSGRKTRFGKQTEYEATFNFRHDVQSWGVSYGAEYSKFGPVIESDSGRLDIRTTGGDARFFIEKQLGRGLVLRFFNGNALRISNRRLRTLYATGQASGRVTSIESRVEKPTHFGGFRLRGTF